MSCLPRNSKLIRIWWRCAISLKEHGFQSEEIIEGRIETNDLMTNPYRDNTQNSVRFIVSQTVTVRSTKVDEVEKALRSTGDLVAKGVILDNQYGSPVSYIFTVE